MKRIARTPLLSIALVASLGACAVDRRIPDDGNVGKTGAERPSFEEWAKASTQQVGDTYLVEGDIAMYAYQSGLWTSLGKP